MDQVQQLVRLVYASQATFKPFHTPEGMECHVAQILSTSRSNNRSNNLFGALYYGSGNFFQCLKGEKTAVENLLAKIQHDSRHKNLKILYEEQIEHLSFQSWEMKYALLEEQTRDFLKQHRISKFDPYQFSLEMTHQFVDVLLASGQNIPSQTLQEVADSHPPFVQKKPPNRVLFWILIAIALLISAEMVVLFLL